MIRRPSARPRRGAAAVEFLVTVPLFVAVMLGALELCMVVERSDRIRRAADVGAQVGGATVETAPVTGSIIEAEAEDAAEAALTALGIDCTGGCTVDATWSADGGTGLYTVEVVITAPYTAVSTLDWIPGTLTRSATVLSASQS